MRGTEFTLHATWDFNNQNSNYDSDTVDDEELPEKSSRAERYLACVIVAELWDWGYRWIY